jgi:anti-sigma factor RsiW
MKCKQLVELVTDYLEGRMPDAQRRLVETHLAECDGCDTYIAQMRLTLEALGRIPPESIPPAARDELIHAFRELRAAS